MMKAGVTIRSIEATDRDWVVRFLEQHWGSDRMVAHGDLSYLMEAARAIKPEIPVVGQYGIPLRAELYLEMSLI